MSNTYTRRIDFTVIQGNADVHDQVFINILYKSCTQCSLLLPDAFSGAHTCRAYVAN